MKEVDVHEPVRIPRSYPRAENRGYNISFIEMSTELQVTLDYES